MLTVPVVLSWTTSRISLKMELYISALFTSYNSPSRCLLEASMSIASTAVVHARENTVPATRHHGINHTHPSRKPLRLCLMEPLQHDQEPVRGYCADSVFRIFTTLGLPSPSYFSFMVAGSTPRYRAMIASKYFEVKAFCNHASRKTSID